MKNEIIYPKLINNIPCGEDLIGGSHKKIANSIASHLNKYHTNEIKSFKLIGLDGGWGTGKSNVIKMLEKDKDFSFHIFTYDAWAHQEDLQRRSFLEELTENLVCEHEKLNKSGKKLFVANKRKSKINNEEKTWKESLGDLLSKNKKVTKKDIPHINPFVILTLLISFLIVPAIKLLIHFFSKNENLWLKYDITGNQIIGNIKLANPLLEILPVSLFLLFWLILAIKDKKYRDYHNIIFLAKDEKLITQTDEIINEKEPSVTEFKSWMKELSADLDKPVVIVFDNLDRLDKEKVKNLWSSINTFFSETVYDNFSVIIPFDRSKIKEVFDADDEKANHFIDKTFSVIYRVSPIVITEWKGYFSKMFSSAFGETENKEEENLVINIFDAHEDSITPRKIIAFVNELVTLKLIWNNEIKLRYMALFSLNKTVLLDKPIEAILNKQFLLRGKDIFGNDVELMDNISALVYNVDVKKASEIPLREKMISLIRNKDSNGLLLLSNENDGFYMILESIFIDRSIQIEDAAISLDKLKNDSLLTQDKIRLEGVWMNIVNKQIDKFKEDKLEFSLVHQILLKNVASSKAEKLVEAILKQLYHVTDFNGKSYFIALNSFRVFIEESKIEVDFLKLIVEHKHSTAEQFIDYVNEGKNDYSLYKVSCENSTLENYLLYKVAKNDFSDCVALEYLDYKEYIFSNLISKLETLIISDDVQLEYIVNLFRMYKAISIEKLLNAKLKDTKINELITNSIVDSEEYNELCSMRLSRTNFYPNFGSGIEDEILNKTDGKTIEQIALRIQNYISYNDLLLAVLRWNQPLLKGVIKYLIVNLKGRTLNIKTILPKFYEIASTLELNAQIILKDFNRWNKHLELEVSNLLTLVPNVNLYIDLLVADNDLSNNIINVAKSYIDKIDASGWDTKLSDSNSYDYKLLLILLKNEKLNSMPINSIDVYKSTLNKIQGNTIKVPVESIEDWNLFYNKQDKSLLSSTIKNIRDRFINKQEIDVEQFQFFGKLLIENGELTERSGDSVRKLITPIIENDDCFKIIFQDKNIYLPIIANSGNDIYDLLVKLRNTIVASPENKERIDFLSELEQLLIPKITVQKVEYLSTQDKKICKDVTEKIINKIRDEKTLHFDITNDSIMSGEDIHVNVLKKLTVDYLYNDVPKHIEFNENTRFELP